MEKTVLVKMGQHSQVISFSSSPSITLEVLKEAIQDKFAEMLQGQEFFLQLKKEKWQGEFVDLESNEEIANGSIIKAVIESMPACPGRVQGAERGSIVVKLILVGESNVGKSGLASRFTKNEFRENQQCSVGPALTTKTVPWGNREVKLHIWDTAGTERFDSVCTMYYRGAQAAVVVYDITEKEAKAYAKKNDFIFLETSAKEGTNVEEIFCAIDRKEMLLK